MSTQVSTKMEMGRVKKYQLDLARYYQIPAVQSSLSVVLSLFIVSIFILFALKPTVVTIVKLQKTIEDSEKTLQQLKTKVTALQKASVIYEQLTPAIPMLEASIPGKSAEYQALTSTIELLAVQTGVVLNTSSLGETLLYSRILSPFVPNKTQGVAALPFSVRVTGEYPAITSFLQNLLTVDRLIKMDSVTYAREGSVRGSSAGSTSLTIVGEAYYLADQAQLQKAIPLKKGGK